MGRDFSEAAEVLEKILEISNIQMKQLEEKSVDELINVDTLRERLFAELMQVNPDFLKDGSLKMISDEIAANDKVVYMNVESLFCVMKEKLLNINKGKSTFAAHTENA